MWYIYTREHYSAIKKNEIMSFAATWMDLEIIIISEISQTESNKYHMILLIHGVQKTNETNKLICKNEIDTHTQKTNLWLPVGEGEDGQMRSLGLTQMH